MRCDALKGWDRSPLASCFSSLRCLPTLRYLPTVPYLGSGSGGGLKFPGLLSPSLILSGGGAGYELFVAYVIQASLLSCRVGDMMLLLSSFFVVLKNE